MQHRLHRATVSDPALVGEEGFATLADIVWTSFFGGVVDLHVLRPPIANAVSDRPVASPLARLQAARGPLVTNLWHRPVKLDDEVARLLLLRVDGRHDRAALAGWLREEVRTGRLQLQLDEEPVGEESTELDPALDRLVQSHLEKMADYALLTA